MYLEICNNEIRHIYTKNKRILVIPSLFRGTNCTWKICKFRSRIPRLSLPQKSGHNFANVLSVTTTLSRTKFLVARTHAMSPHRVRVHVNVRMRQDATYVPARM